MQQENIALERIITLEEVFAMARNHLFKYGGHTPLIVVNLRPCKLYLIPIGKDPMWDEGDEAKVFSLFFNGRQFARDEQITTRDVFAIYLLQEVWYLTHEDGPITDLDLESDLEQQARRHEALAVFELKRNPSGFSTMFYRSEIIRVGEILDTGPVVTIPEQNPRFLPAFFAGISTGKWDDETFRAHLGEYLSGP